jgi:hypothetical protein
MPDLYTNIIVSVDEYKWYTMHSPSILATDLYPSSWHALSISVIGVSKYGC